MPLSQGYCLKPSLGAKKRAMKVLRQEQQDQGHILPPSSQAAQCYLPHSDRQNSLHLSYWLGESFAMEGNLSNAFDVYELIASRQLEGHVPLDKLTTLATALTSHIRQMGGIATPTVKSPRVSERLDIMPWSRYHHRQGKQNPADQLEFLRGVGECESMGATSPSPLDLHSPTRELRVPSPLQDWEDYDPLLCPLCGDILRCPVTTNCGHTFCRQCCETITQCNICQVRFPRIQDSYSSPGPPGTTGCALTTTTASGAGSSFFTAPSNHNANLSLMSFPVGYGVQLASSVHRLAAPPMTVTTTTVASTTATATTTMASTSAAAALGLSGYPSVHGGGSGSSAMKFMPDVLVRRLVEKWWGPDLQAKKIGEKASSCMHLNLLDDALKFCNASLEKAPANFKSLCLRAEVLLKLSHFQSSLADIENALRTRCTSPKAHYLRALALSGLGRLEEALYNGFLAICLDKNTNLSNSEIFQHDLAKILQRLLAQMPKNRSSISTAAPPVFQPQHRSFATSRAPYPLLWEQVRRRRKQQHHHIHHHHHHVHLDDVEDEFGHYDDYIMAGDDMEEEVEVEVDGGEPGSLHLDGDFLFPSALDFMDHHRHQRHVFEQKQFDLQPRRHANRKHCKRKWSAAMEPLGGRIVEEEDVDQDQAAGESQRCSRLFAGVLERTQQELQRLRSE
uniref:Uncharacterized protein LOC108048169 n=1 Tax=Drosophila rhopaloa TaxID=1041015 RepID=A0A6P4F170_DRORH